MAPATDPLADRLARAPTWRVLALATGVVIAPLAAIVLLVAIARTTQPYSPVPPGLHQVVVGLPVVLALYAAGHRIVLRAPASAFLAGRPDRTVVAWTVLGLLFPAAVLGLQLVVLGATSVGRPPALATTAGLVASSLAAGLLAGVVEELAFRGALLRLLEVRWNPRVAVAVTSMVFALLHQGHATGPVELALVLGAMGAAGVFLGLVVVRTRSVWNAVVLHAGWNTVFGGQVVSVATAGGASANAVARVRLPDHPTLYTGGEATLGAAPLTTGLLVLAALAVARYGHHGGPNRAGAASDPPRGAGR